MPDDPRPPLDRIPDLDATRTLRDHLATLPARDIATLLETRQPLELDLTQFLEVVPREILWEVIRCWWFSSSYDPGPPCDFGLRFASAPDLAALHPGKFRPEFGPVFHRGRLDGNARLLVVGQDPGTDEQLARRSFIGQSGQRLQGLLRKIGLASSYLILNTFHLGIDGQYGDGFEPISTTDPLLSWRNGLFDLAKAKNTLAAVLTVGSAARDAVDAWPGVSGLTRVHVQHPSAANFGSALFPGWTDAVSELSAVVAADPGMSVDATPYGTEFTADVVEDIPRRDLPWGLPDWFGRSGETWSHREESGQELCWEAP